jgi:hypothetical protein
VSPEDIIDLLCVIAAVDRRTIGEADVLVWHELIGDLPKDLALQAIKDHFREQPGVWLEPGHIVAGVRAIRHDRAMREPIEARHDDERGEGYVAALLAVAEIGRRVDGDTSWPHRNAPSGPTALLVACPYPPCRAPVGRRCYNSATRRALKGHHPSRIDAAAQGMSDDSPVTPPPTPPPATPGATCPICERELVTPEEAAHGICDRCKPNVNGDNSGQRRATGA